MRERGGMCNRVDVRVGGGCEVGRQSNVLVCERGREGEWKGYE